MGKEQTETIKKSIEKSKNDSETQTKNIQNKNNKNDDEKKEDNINIKYINKEKIMKK